MTRTVRRAGAFAAVASIAVVTPVLGRLVALAFGTVAVAAFAVRDGTLFELFARPGDRRAGRLESLSSFALAACALAVLTTEFGLPASVYVGTVLLVGYGNLGAVLARLRAERAGAAASGFVVAGFVAAVLGQLGVRAVEGSASVDGPLVADVVFLAASGALLAGLLRAVFLGREEALSLATVGLVLWLFTDLAEVDLVTMATALLATMALGYAAWTMETASIPGLLTGLLLGLLTLVLGGYDWFVVLIAFFAIGGLSTQYRYDEKLERGVAEARGGARGSGNVLGNSGPALAAVVLFAASPELSVDARLFEFAFAGSIATALGDTVSSEVGGLYDDPRLVTTLERVEPGTDGGVTWQGTVAGVAGVALVAGLGLGLFGHSVAGAAAVVIGGAAGMLTDSLVGATVEGSLVGNQGVNFLATLTGAVVGGATWYLLFAT